MSTPVKIHAGKTPVRIHYIAEWAAKRNLRQADIARELSVDKSNVSRWFKGTLPSEDHLVRLAALFHTEVSSIFRHPSEDWLARLLRGKTEEEVESMIRLIEIVQGPKTGTDG